MDKFVRDKYRITLVVKIAILENGANVCVDQGRFSDPDSVSGTHQRENVKFDDNLRYHSFICHTLDDFTT